MHGYRTVAEGCCVLGVIRDRREESRINNNNKYSLNRMGT